MKLTAHLTTLEEIGRWRDLYRKEMDCQIIHDSIHTRPGWSLEYGFKVDGDPAGYGSIAVGGPWKDNPTIYEFYVLPQRRNRLFDLFGLLLEASRARQIETQSNDALLTAMLYAFAQEATSQSILFHDKMTTALAPPAAVFRQARADDGFEIPADRLWSHGVVEIDNAPAGKGGILFHYNRPYGDIYMEVGQMFRRRGVGSFLVQELKRVCRERGYTPCARCNPKNVASRKTLQKAGFVPCGHILGARISP